MSESQFEYELNIAIKREVQMALLDRWNDLMLQSAMSLPGVSGCRVRVEIQLERSNGYRVSNMFDFDNYSRNFPNWRAIIRQLAAELLERQP